MNRSRVPSVSSASASSGAGGAGKGVGGGGPPSRLGQPRWANAQSQAPQDQSKAFEALLRNARVSGNLNLAARNLNEFPEKVALLLDARFIGPDEKW